MSHHLIAPPIGYYRGAIVPVRYVLLQPDAWMQR
jgi:hypothetical protein